jgi:hypothetical protein
MTPAAVNDQVAFDSGSLNSFSKLPQSYHAAKIGDILG